MYNTRMKRSRAIIAALIAIFFIISFAADLYYYHKVKQPPQDGPWQIAYSDFRVFWTTGWTFRHRYCLHDPTWGTPDYRYRPPYDFETEFYHFRYSPIVAIAFMPLAHLPMGIGLLVWYGLLNVFFLVALIVLDRVFAERVRHLRRMRQWLPAMVCVAAALFYFNNIALGQTDILIALLLTLFLFFHVRKNDLACAFCLAAMLQFKPFFAVMPAYFLVSGRWKMPLYTAVFFTTLLAAPMLTVGLHQGSLLVHEWVKMMNMSVQGQLANLKNQSFSYMLVNMGGMAGSHPGILLVPAGVCLFLLAVLYSMRLADKAAGKTLDSTFEISYLTLVVLLATPLIWKASFVYLVIPYAFFIYRYAGGVRNKAALLLFIISVVLTSVVNSDMTKYIASSLFRPFKTIPIGTLCLLLSIVAIHQSALQDKR